MQKKSLISIFIAFVIIVSFMLNFIFNNQKRTNEIQTEFLFNSYITLKLYDIDGDSDEIFKNNFNFLSGIDHIFDVYNENSEIFKVNNTAFKSEIKVSDIFAEVLEKALEYAAKTEGRFDPTIGKISEIWKNSKNSVPEIDERMLKGANYKNVILHKDVNTVRFLNEYVKLDFGACLKGFAADELKREFKDNKVKIGVADLGGNILTFDVKEKHIFKVGINSPGNQSQNSVSIKGTKTIVTSGDYERYNIIDGVKYCHIIEPATGKAISRLDVEFDEKKVSGVTVIDENGFQADVLSTAIFVEVYRNGLSLAKKYVEDNFADSEIYFVNSVGDLL